MIQNEIANQLGCEFDEGYVMVNKKNRLGYQMSMQQVIFIQIDIMPYRHC